MNMYKGNLALSNLQGLINHKTQQNKINLNRSNKRKCFCTRNKAEADDIQQKL